MSAIRQTQFRVSYHDWRASERMRARRAFVAKLGNQLPTIVCFLCIGGLCWVTLGMWGVATAGFVLAVTIYSNWKREIDHESRLERNRVFTELDEFDAQAEHFLVGVDYRDGCARSASDFGVLWFEGERMHFVGNYSSFSITPDDVNTEKRALSHWFDEPPFEIPLIDLGYCGQRTMALTEVVPPRAAAPFRKLSWALGEFVSQPKVGYHGEVPPKGLGPGGGPVGGLSSGFRRLIWSLCVAGLAAALSVTGANVVLVVIPVCWMIADRDAIESFRDFNTLRWRLRESTEIGPAEAHPISDRKNASPNRTP